MHLLLQTIPQQVFLSQHAITATNINQEYADICNNLLVKLGARFSFVINVLESISYHTQYTLVPTDTIIFHRKPNLWMLSHEMGHHAYHKVISKKNKIEIRKICGFEDPNESFAAAVELHVTGKTDRFEKDPTFSLTTAKQLRPVVKHYFR